MTPASSKALTRKHFVEHQQLRSRAARVTQENLQNVQRRLEAARMGGTATPQQLALLVAASRRLATALARPHKRPKPLRRSNARSIEALHSQVLALLLEGIRQGVLTAEKSGSIVTREAVARTLGVPNHQVEQVFCRLRIARLLVQDPNDGPHDSYRARMFGGSMTGWAPTYWRLVNPDVWAVAAAEVSS